ncbi:MAG: N-6 DNA methylase [Actinomycetota bacterium]
MTLTTPPNAEARYSSASEAKASGRTYTPAPLARFVARNILDSASGQAERSSISVLDPAVGDGELIIALLDDAVSRYPTARFMVTGFDTNESALALAQERIASRFPAVALSLRAGDFLNHVLLSKTLLADSAQDQFDIVIANPPYVRTQVIGAQTATAIRQQWGLTGRVDLYHAFVRAIADVLAPDGTAGIIISNRFIATRSGSQVRHTFLERYRVQHVWDFGDTKLFDAAVLPAVVVATGSASTEHAPAMFTSIYEAKTEASASAVDPVAAVEHEGLVRVADGRVFNVRHGSLDHGVSTTGVWRIGNVASDDWLATVAAHTHRTFGELGKIRVGVKTCADKVFINPEWTHTAPDERPELLRPLTTHHVARRFRAITSASPRMILYPHESFDGKRRAVDLMAYPLAKAYLERHRSALESRTYLLDAGRDWFELWVPQDPALWPRPKLVFRDISEQPTFWLDLDGSVINGDCYWLVSENPEEDDLLWLAAAVANSRFCERFYDLRFHNKLYAGRRRYITQYVNEFPLPDPELAVSRQIVATAQEIYREVDSPAAHALQDRLERLVSVAFGLEESLG